LRSPDKHRGDPQAAKRFERLGLVNKILRDARRDRYDHFLSCVSPLPCAPAAALTLRASSCSKGFPKWRKNESGAADFYYQRWRPSLALVLAILVLFTSGVQHVVQRLTYARDLERLTTLTENAQLVAWGPAFRNSTAGGRPERKVRVEVRAPPLPPKNADKEEEERTLRRLLASRTEEGPRIEVRVSEQGLYVSDGEGGWESLGKETLTLPSVHTTWPLALLRRLTGAQAPAPAREQPAAAVEKVKKAQ
jgi:hypothetical protein